MDQKSAYVKKAKAELDLLQSRMDGLNAKARSAEADGEINFQQHIAELKAKRDAAYEHLSRLSKAGKEALEELKEGFSQAASDLKTSLDKAVSLFN